MANIVFTDPPPGPRRASAHPWDDIAEALRARPGEWALCLRGVHSSYSSQIKRGALSAFKPAGAFEARSVSTLNTDENGKKTNDLYIRFVGNDETASGTEDDADNA